MIQFFGLHLGRKRSEVAAMGRDLELWAHTTATLMNVAEAPTSAAIEVPCAEWIRAGSYALQEAYFQLPVKARKLWGIGLSGPSGWIALDFDYEPLSPLRLTGAGDVASDFQHWLQLNPRAGRRISVLLSPKDYFRFAVSGALAADVSSASRLGCLEPGEAQWSAALVKQQRLQLAWLPPVFDCHVPTGRLSEEGIRRTSLPGGAWLVAGAHEDEAEIIAGGDPRAQDLWIHAEENAPARAAYGIQHLQSVAPPPGWRLLRSPIAGQQVLECELDPLDGGIPMDSEHPRLQDRRRELETAGFTIRRVVVAAGSAATGAAALAAIGSGLVKSWDHYFKKRPPSAPA